MKNAPIKITGLLKVASIAMLLMFFIASCASSSGYHKRPPAGKFKCK